jgi:hypothetical protein
LAAAGYFGVLSMMSALTATISCSRGLSGIVTTAAAAAAITVLLCRQPDRTWTKNDDDDDDDEMQQCSALMLDKQRALILGTVISISLLLFLSFF